MGWGRYSLVELFCGCGGFSRGFAMTGRFDVALGVDVKPWALATFRENVSQGTLMEDVRGLTGEKLSGILGGLGVREGLDCLIGGPPCQGFSRARTKGSRKGRGYGYDASAEDPRNDLALRFVRLAKELRPRVVVMENVPQVLSHRVKGVRGGLASQVLKRLEGLGYECSVGVLNAADFGVPQRRRRAIFVASRVGRIGLPQPTHGEGARRGGFDDLAPWVTVREAIGDLPSPPMEGEPVADDPAMGFSGPPSNGFLALMRTSPRFPAGHVARRLGPGVLAIIRRMRPGEDWQEACRRLREGSAAGSPWRKNYYRNAYGRLSWDEPALTITAAAWKPSCGRFTHPGEDRGITVREAARLQSFDDSFSLRADGSPNGIAAGMDMLGEAVPPLLAMAVAREVAGALDAAGG